MLQYEKKLPQIKLYQYSRVLQIAEIKQVRQSLKKYGVALLPHRLILVTIILILSKIVTKEPFH